LFSVKRGNNGSYEERKMFKKIKSFIPAFVASFFVLTHNAMALDWDGITLDTSDVDSVMGLVVVGLAAMWGFRKVIKTMNRS
jgi:hypothetical protein